MLQRLIASRLITTPAIWGKLRGHADFVRSGMRHGESEGWQPWLAQQGRVDGSVITAALPTAFVLPPGTLNFARHRFVIGVITPSMDKVGRPHALMVYQLAHTRWMKLNYGSQDRTAQDWLFWLARAVARHAGLVDVSDIQSLQHTVQGLWQMHEPGLRQLWAAGAGSASRFDAGHQHVEPAQVMQDLLDRLSGHASANDPAAQLQGVRYFPWADWPQRLLRQRGEGTFWQQDAAGGYVNAAARLPMLWSGV